MHVVKLVEKRTKPVDHIQISNGGILKLIEVGIVMKSQYLQLGFMAL